MHRPGGEGKRLLLPAQDKIAVHNAEMALIKLKVHPDFKRNAIKKKVNSGDTIHNS